MESLCEASLDFWLTTGRFGAAFESALAARIGRKHAFAVNSGSSANLLAMAALCSPLLKDRRLRPGDEVITVAAGFPTTVAPLVQLGGAKK
jgi:CDP-6-deoxy-D-xylo-4-hexulose-3-dehydrase